MYKNTLNSLIILIMKRSPADKCHTFAHSFLINAFPKVTQQLPHVLVNGESLHWILFSVFPTFEAEYAVYS
jgi:hypothetical protein